MGGFEHEFTDEELSEDREPIRTETHEADRRGNVVLKINGEWLLQTTLDEGDTISVDFYDGVKSEQSADNEQ